MVKINSRENLIRIVEQYKNLIFSVCLKMTGDYFAAEDITQDTFLSVYQNFSKFDGKDEKAWICRIASNKCIDYLRSAEHKKTTVIQDDEFDDKGTDEFNPHAIYESREVVEQLRRACINLSPPYSLISIYYFVEGMTAREIAEKTDTNLKTVQTQIRRSREMLKKIIRKEDLAQ